MNIVPIRGEDEAALEAHRRTLTVALCSWFVRRDGKYYAIDNLSAAISKPDVKIVALQRFRKEFPDVPLSNELLKAVFTRALEQTHTDEEQIVAVWGGRKVCLPGNLKRIVVQQGLAVVNTWTQPAYRRLGVQGADYGIVGRFVDWVFPRQIERDMVLNWLAWCLQNEADKPTWAPFLYSKTKGSGKSTFAQIVTALFGPENSVTQNNIDQLVSRFNMTALQSKLVISEELKLRQDSSQSNALKTYITENTTLAEFKGKEAERVTQYCCFLLTTNHLPLWIEAEDRRYYVVEFDHDGHAAGARSDEFAKLVGQVLAFLQSPDNVARLYNALVARQLPDGFSAKTLNVDRDATDVMKRIHQAAAQVTTEQLREHLAKKGLFAISETSLAEVAQVQLRANANQLRHVMAELGWNRLDVKWGGVDYTRKLWVHPDCAVYRGNLTGPGGKSVALETHLQLADGPALNLGFDV
ncbi:DUF5906 domain-containing protein [Tabrizicola sp. J26]|uniref:primase-helicase family protein n=1 Tax=Alitabrizicola rongguiensis TaxID=2909234 RepID=UPI001F33927B|nr:primase-helicase family protein [Tabrizicola rongguiensis]MCF1711163.1 DUF5906 domain-containing protein [Tabrizicola rongguiensis]